VALFNYHSTIIRERNVQVNTPCVLNIQYTSHQIIKMSKPSHSHAKNKDTYEMIEFESNKKKQRSRSAEQVSNVPHH